MNPTDSTTTNHDARHVPDGTGGRGLRDTEPHDSWRAVYRACHIPRPAGHVL